MMNHPQLVPPPTTGTGEHLLSRAVSEIMDAADPITGEYTLEVSSPGIDRPLTRPGDFARWIGHAVRIELARPIDGRRRFTGTIVSEGEDGVHLEIDDETELVAGVHEMSRATLVLTDELIEAARVEGVSEWRIFWYIVLPLMRPAIAALSVLVFTFIWNDFFWATVLTQGVDAIEIVNQRGFRLPPQRMAQRIGGDERPRPPRGGIGGEVFRLLQ